MQATHNLVLYRKYRPKKFSEIIGQEHIIQTLTNAISQNLISHSYLFYGPKGCGKTSTARILAKAVNCQNKKDYEPCNSCPNCQEIDNAKGLDLIEIDAASNRGIDQIRDLKESIRFSPVKLKYKFFIIDESHMLTKEAANALLKTLEEPPRYIIFVLATTEIDKIIPTIASRCQRFDFKRLTIKETIFRLEKIAKKENLKVEKEVFNLIATNSQGSLRDAESIFEKIITFFIDKKEIQGKFVRNFLGIIEIRIVSQFIDYLKEKNVKQAITLVNNFYQKGYDLENFLKSVIDYLRKMLLLKVNNSFENNLDLLSKEEKEKIVSTAKLFSDQDLKKILEILLNAKTKLKYSSIPQLPLELAIIDICDLEKESYD